MGHENEFQTNTYLEEIDDSLVAEAKKMHLSKIRALDSDVS